MTTVDYPFWGPEADATSDDLVNVLKPDDAASQTVETGADDFYGLADRDLPTDHLATSLVRLDELEMATEQDHRWARGLVVLRPGARDVVLRTVALNAGAQAAPVLILRANRQRKSATVLNPPAPVGDGVTVIWLGKEQTAAKVGVGFPLIAGASWSEEYSGDLWAIATVQGALVSISAPIYSEGTQ